MTRATVVFLLALSACVPEEGPMMRPFQDCLECHAQGGQARAWTAAGTWFKGSHVTLLDATGKTLSLTGNDAGNFYTAEALVFPLRVSVNGEAMPHEVTYGGCNLCHTRADAPTAGELMAPGRPCLSCHAPGGVASSRPFSAAGTWSRASVAVTVGTGTTQQTTTLANGNFYFSATTTPIAFPHDVRVGGESMDAPHGNCNICHGNGRGEDD